MSCVCHVPTVVWCSEHGEPLRLKPGERVMKQDHLDTLWSCLDPAKAERMATLIRKAQAKR